MAMPHGHVCPVASATSPGRPGPVSLDTVAVEAVPLEPTSFGATTIGPLPPTPAPLAPEPDPAGASAPGPGDGVVTAAPFSEAMLPASTPFVAGSLTTAPPHASVPPNVTSTPRPMKAERPIIYPQTRLAVAVPELNTPDPAHEGTPNHLPLNEPPRQIQPNDRVRTQPKKLAHRGVVPVDDPGRSAGRGVHVLREGGPRHPARTMMDRVEFHACRTQPRRERMRKYGLARTGSTDDEDSLHSFVRGRFTSPGRR